MRQVESHWTISGNHLQVVTERCDVAPQSDVKLAAVCVEFQVQLGILLRDRSPDSAMIRVHLVRVIVEGLVVRDVLVEATTI